MYKINVVTSFSAAHSLRGYDGECKNLHGHNWKVRVCIKCEKTDEIGLTIDFKKVKKNVNLLMDSLDHKFLNEIEHFKTVNPTSENISKFIFEELEKEFNEPGIEVFEIEVWESENSSMVYYKG